MMDLKNKQDKTEADIKDVQDKLEAYNEKVVESHHAANLALAYQQAFNRRVSYGLQLSKLTAGCKGFGRGTTPFCKSY